MCYTDAYGLIELSTSGGVPGGQYFLMDSSLMISQQSTNIFDSLQSSLYSVWFFDGNNCPSDTIFGIKLGEPGKISVQSSVLNTSCYNFSDGKIESLVLIKGLKGLG